MNVETKMLSVAFILSICVFSAMVFNQVSANPQTRLSIINPSTGDGKFMFHKGALLPTNRFIVNITVSNVANLSAWQIKVDFNRTLLNCVDIGLPSGSPFANRTRGINNEAGYVMFDGVLKAGREPFSGNGTLCQVEFEIVKEPPLNGKVDGDIRFDQSNTYLLDSSGKPIPALFEGSHYELEWPLTFDILLPSLLFALSLTVVFVHSKYEDKMKEIMEERKLTVKDAVLLVAAMGVMVSIIVFIPSMALAVLFLMAYCLLTFAFTYIAVSKWYIAILPPIVFVLLYLFFWNIYILNAFTLVFAVLITVYLGNLFSWKVTGIFAGLLTGMDIIQVLITRSMVEAARGLTRLQLPVAVQVPLVPLISTKSGLFFMMLGLGDLFFAALLTLAVSKEYGVKLAVISALGISISFFLFETFILTYGVHAFPGTLMILCGWAPVVLAKEFQKRRLR